MKIYMELQGGLGNQIFQYLFGCLVARSIGIERFRLIDEWLDDRLALNSSMKALFSLTDRNGGYDFSKYHKHELLAIRLIDKIAARAPRALRGSFYKTIGKLSGIYIFREEDYNTLGCEEMVSLIATHVKKARRTVLLILRGYWQNYRDIEVTREIIKSSGGLSNALNRSDGKLRPKKIAVHIRRGDYINNLMHAQAYASNLSIVDYVANALNCLSNGIDRQYYSVMFISDDIEWSKLVFSYLKSKWNVSFGSSVSTLDDWIEMVNADILICSNSTFSYSAALAGNILNKSKVRTVLIPLWFDNKSTTISRGWNTLRGTICI
jgi:hypothetical protein